MHFTRVAPRHANQFQAMVEAPVRFGADWNAMRVNEARLNQQIAVQPRFAFGILSEHAEQLLRTLEESQTTRGRVEHLEEAR